VGPHLQDRSRKFLYDLTKSKNLWRRRIAIMSTYHYIRQRDFEDTLKIARILRDDPQDLIHKAVGWMLREVGNRDRKAEEAFLQKHYKKMPRTMLRYAIEKLPERRRKAYLNGQVSPLSS
jgi:3-methyladenine DNA glycosylase AlkD